jgi:hypothetical protein
MSQNLAGRIQVSAGHAYIDYLFVNQNQINEIQYCRQMMTNPREMADGPLEVR